MPFFKETNNKIVFYPKLYNNRYISGELDLIEDYDVCVRVVDGVAKEEGYAEDLFDEKFDAMFLKAD
ncbi:hypothetical protein H8D85_01995 [bacterium]|nr:hypothetical protein [bacterium]